MPEYSLSHRYSEFACGSSATPFAEHLRDEMVAAGWTLVSTNASGDFTLDSGSESVSHDKMRVRIYSGTDGSYPVIRYNVQKPWASGWHPRIFALDGWTMACSISKYQVCWFKKTNDGAHQGRYGYFGILKKPAFYESAGYCVNGSAMGSQRNPDAENWRNGAYYAWSHESECLTSKVRGYIPSFYVDGTRMVLPYFYRANRWAVTDDWGLLEPDVFTGGHQMSVSGVLHGRLFDALVLAGQYDAGSIITYDGKDWIALTHQSGANMTLFFLAENF